MNRKIKMAGEITKSLGALVGYGLFKLVELPVRITAIPFYVFYKLDTMGSEDRGSLSYETSKELSDECRDFILRGCNSLPYIPI